MKNAAIFRYQSRLLFHSSSQTVDGVWIGNDWCEDLSSDATAEEIGNMVIAAHAASQIGIPHPTKFDFSSSPLLKLAGVRTWKQLETTAACVEVYCESEYVIDPMRSLKPKAGYVGIPGKTIRVPATATPREIGEAVRAALAISE